MTRVGIFKSWDWPSLARQTPGRAGVWEDVVFVEEAESADYLIILNSVTRAVTVHCPPEHIWTLVQEPPIPLYARYHQGIPQSARVYTQDRSLANERYIHSHGALPWHVERDYDWLKKCPPPEKVKTLSWVTSSSTAERGQAERMQFLKRIRGVVEFDLWGIGFAPLDDKWDGLAPYRYALVIENYSGPDYWSEKIADCFLAWTMPIYYGCVNIGDYFPSESFVQIDIHAADAAERIREVAASDRWARNLDAVAHARQLVLDRYQLHPFIVAEIKKHESTAEHSAACSPQLTALEPIKLPKGPLLWRIQRRIARFNSRRHRVRRASVLP